MTGNQILTAMQWKQCSTWHASYVDYVRQMREIQDYLAVASHHSQGGIDETCSRRL